MKRLPLSRTRQRRRNWWRPLCALALLALVLGACRVEEEGGELSGAIGPGSGPPLMGADPGEDDLLERPAGVTIGMISHHSVDFMHDSTCEQDDAVDYCYVSVAELIVTVSPITGRPDTPCRFVAAILARDEGFTILASGDVTNDTGLTFHQVNLAKGSTFQRFYCTELRPNLGVMIGATSLNGNKLGSEQMHFLLNSVTN